MTTNPKPPMKLWILRPIYGEDCTFVMANFSCAYGYMVRAETEHDARLLVSVAIEEVSHRRRRASTGPSPWFDPALSTCDELMADGEPGVMMRDELNTRPNLP